MPKLKLFLSADFDVDAHKIKFNDSMWAPILTIRTKAQRNAPISECFFIGKAQGQQYAWLEANLVFEVARRLARSGVPALTVHDEFIVPMGKEELVREFMYTTDFPASSWTIWPKPWKKFLEKVLSQSTFSLGPVDLIIVWSVIGWLPRQASRDHSTRFSIQN